MTRRYLLFLFLILFVIIVKGQDKQFLSPWSIGMMDVHFISTGTGNCAFYILPDGTTLLVDAGELDPTSSRTNSPRNTPRFPNYSKLGYQWQVEYIYSQLQILNRDHIDYALITHYHDDHFGGMYSGIPKSKNGDYYLSGITGIGDNISIRKLLDRGYSYPLDMRKVAKKSPESYPDLINYWNFIQSQRVINGLEHEEFNVGSKTQISLKFHPEKFSSFSVRNIHANGRYWSGSDDKTILSSMPEITEKLYPSVMPGENPLSCGIRINYGDFTLYTGGDIAGKQPDYMKTPKSDDIESLVAPVIGEADVVTCNHHANRDAMSEIFLRETRPRVIVQQVWSSDHPGHEALIRMTSKNIWPDDRDLFATAMLEANKLVIGDLIHKSYKSLNGHVVIRVLPPGDKYYVYVLDNENIEPTVKNVFGPYVSKKKLK